MTCAFRHVAPFDGRFILDDGDALWFAPAYEPGVGNDNPDGLIECITRDRCAVVKGACDTSAFPEPGLHEFKGHRFFQWWRPRPPGKGQGVQRFMFVCQEGPC